MKKNFIISSFLFAGVAAGSLLSKYFGWYNTYWFTDIILHTISGMAFGFLWIGLQKRTVTSAWFIVLVGAASFATLGSVLWEFWEFAGWRLTPAQVPFYLPQLSDTLGDILCGMIGGAAGAGLALILKKKENA
jgi:hypothetical protein